MTPRRLIAAAAAIATVLVLQATILTPLTAPLAVSLPAVLVAAVGLEAGVSAGMSVGFALGLLADLGSEHAAGVLALVWLVLGTGCGLLAGRQPQRLWRAALTATLAVSVTGLVAVGVLGALHAPRTSVFAALALTPPTVLANAVLAVMVTIPVRLVLRSHGLRVRQPQRRDTVATPLVRAQGLAASDG